MSWRVCCSGGMERCGFIHYEDMQLHFGCHLVFSGGRSPVYILTGTLYEDAVLLKYFTFIEVLKLDAMDKTRRYKIVGCSGYSGGRLLGGFNWPSAGYCF